jgi:hypothetical protein
LGRARDRQGDDGQTYSLACPFYKKDRHKYHFCLGYHLRRIKDVKQHVYRKHSKPDFYCSRCFHIFDDAASRDAHTRLASCQVRTDPQYDGISGEQKKVLAQYASRTKRTHEQWFEMWDNIFPGDTRPASVGVGSYVEEMVPLLRAFWDSRRLEIMANISQTTDVENTIRDTVNQVMETLFDRFEKETSGLAVEWLAEATWLGAGLNCRSQSQESTYTVEGSPFAADVA